MKCEEFKNKLYFYAAHEMEPGAEAEMDAHAKGCPACLELLGGFRATLSIVDRNPAAEPAKNWNYFAEKTLEKIHGSKPYRLLKSAAAVSFLVCALAFGYFHYAQKKTAESAAAADEAATLAYYLTDFDLPELEQGI